MTPIKDRTQHRPVEAGGAGGIFEIGVAQELQGTPPPNKGSRHKLIQVNTGNGLMMRVLSEEGPNGCWDYSFLRFLSTAFFSHPSAVLQNPRHVLVCTKGHFGTSFEGALGLICAVFFASRTFSVLCSTN
jgi:hypothetical protein